MWQPASGLATAETISARSIHCRVRYTDWRAKSQGDDNVLRGIVKSCAWRKVPEWGAAAAIRRALPSWSGAADKIFTSWTLTSGTSQTFCAVANGGWTEAAFVQDCHSDTAAVKDSSLVRGTPCSCCGRSWQMRMCDPVTDDRKTDSAMVIALWIPSQPLSTGSVAWSHNLWDSSMSRTDWTVSHCRIGTIVNHAYHKVRFAECTSTWV